MADIRCPNCGKSNPDFLDACQFCQSPLRRDAAPNISKQPTRKTTGELKDVLPEWLKNTREQAKKSAEEIDGQPPVSSANATPAPRITAVPPDDLPDWVKAMAPKSPAEIPSEEEEMPDWITRIGKNVEPSTSESSDGLDWLRSIQPKSKPELEIAPGNPYIAGNPVGDSAAFIGRADILREVQRILGNPNQNAMTLFGQRRIGKTSLLQYLETQLPKVGPYQTIYFDLQDRAAKSLEDVLVELGQTISRKLGLGEPDFNGNAKHNFQTKWLPEILGSMPAGQSLVLLFDEFDVLADPQGGQAARDFFPYLRGLLALDRLRLQFIFVMGRNIGDLNQIALSLLKGVPDRRVSLFNREEVERLVLLSEKNKSLYWDSAAVNLIWELTNGHPYLTQAICWDVWERLYDQDPTSTPMAITEDVKAVIDRTLEKSRNTLEWLWGGLGPAEKVVSSALAQSTSSLVTDTDLENILSESGVRVLVRELREAPQLLQEWDLLEPADNGYRFRVELLRRWILRYHPLHLVQKELDTINPAAENLYQAAYAIYQGANLQQATPLLQQSLALNPNHRRAAELLSEIYIADGKLDAAETLLNGLFELYPAAARPRLIQIYLRYAQEAEDDNKKLENYQKVLTLNLQNPEALNGKQRIWTQRGEQAYAEQNWEAALDAFQQAGVTEKIDLLKDKIREETISRTLQSIEELERQKDYEEALERASTLIQKYPDVHARLPYFEQLRAKAILKQKYSLALGALQQGDRDHSIRLLLEILGVDPEYLDTSRLLHLVITGQDAQFLADENRRLYEVLNDWVPLSAVRSRLLRTIVVPQRKLLYLIDQHSKK